MATLLIEAPIEPGDPIRTEYNEFAKSHSLDWSATPIYFREEFGGGEEVEAVGPQFIRGMVLDVDGNPVQRKVFCISREDGQRLAETVSGTDGFFVVRPRSLEATVLVAVPLDSEPINAVVLDNILPVPD